MSRRLWTCVTAASAFAAVLAASSPASWAQGDPTQQWFFCYGPQAQGRLVAPKDMYVSEVSTAIHVTGQTTLLAQDAFKAFVVKKYGADFEPRCDWYSTEAQTSKARKGWAAASGRKEITTGWTWTQPESDKNPPPPPKPKPGALEH